MMNGRSRVALLLLAAVALIPTRVSAQVQIALNGSAAPAGITVTAGSTVAVSITNSPGSTTDWIAFYPMGAADGAYSDWRYFNNATAPPAVGLTNATVTFAMPVTPGTYEWRVFANNGFDRLATSAPVTVVASSATLTVNGLDPPTAAPAAAGTMVTVQVNNGPGIAGDWVGFYAAGAADGASLSWHYLNGTTSPPATGFVTSTLMFQSPSSPGSYEFRFFAANGFSRLATSTTLVVSASTAQLAVNGVAPPSAVTVAAGATAVVSVSSGPANATDWVALSLRDAPNTGFVDWRYLNNATVPPAAGLPNATVTFTMPVIPGPYEFRLFANNSVDRLTTSAPVTVATSSATVIVNGINPPTAAAAAAETLVTVEVDGGPGNAGDWVAFYASGAPDGVFLSWQYLNGTTSPPAMGSATSMLMFHAPASPGSYEFRFFAANGFSRLATSTTLVVSASTAQLAVNGVVPPLDVTVAAGSTAVVSVSSGPANATDWVALYLSGAPTPSFLDWRYMSGTTVAPQAGLAAATLTFTMPTTAGLYEFRFLGNNTFDVLTTSSAVTVTPPTAQITVNTVLPPASVSVAPSASLSVHVAGGPANATDWIGLAQTGAPASTVLSWMYLNGATTPPVAGVTSADLTFTVPPGAGSYELRFFANNGVARLATSATIMASSTLPTVSVSVTNPFPGTMFVAPASLRLDANVTVIDGTITRVDFFDGTMLVGTAINLAYEITWNSPSVGAHILTAQVTDNSGHVTTSSPIAITVNASGADQGTLGTPIADLRGGTYGPGHAVSLQAAVGTLIYYTTDGSSPTSDSQLYQAPIALGTTTMIRAVAFENGWSPSAIMVESYTVDTTPPFLIAMVSPSPNAAGWNNTAVTVSFTCDDPSGVQTCPSPVAVLQDGAGQVVSGTATDVFGNQATTSVTLNIDRTPPAVVLSAPDDRVVTMASDVVATAQVTASLSPIASATCNGVPATVVSGAVNCTIALRPGLNAVIVSALNMAGTSASAGRRVTRSTNSATLAISPTTRTLFIGQSGTVTATTESGVVASDVTWNSSNPSIVSISQTPKITIAGQAAGTATITATGGGVSAQALVTVLASGPSATELVQWTVAPIPGSISELPIYAHRVDDDGPDVFDVSLDSTGATNVRATRFDGSQVWTASMPGQPVFGDAFGGLVAVEYTSSSAPTSAVVRLGDSSSALPWRYESAGSIWAEGGSGVAQGPDGTVYLTESVSGSRSPTGQLNQAAFLVALDGVTGALKFRLPLPSSTHRFTGLSGPVAYDYAARVTSPVVGVDGAVYVAVDHINDEWHSLPPPPRILFSPGPREYHLASGSGSFATAETLELVRVDSTAASTSQTLFTKSTSGPDDPGAVYRFEGLGLIGELAADETGILANWTAYRREWIKDSNWQIGGNPACDDGSQYDHYCFHYGDDATTQQAAQIAGESVTTRTLQEQPGYQSWDWPVTLVGDNNTAILQRDFGVEAVDTTTLSTLWTVNTSATAITTLFGGDVAVQDYDGTLSTIVDGVLSPLGSLPVFNPSQIALGVWVGLSNDGLTAQFGVPLNESTFAFQGIAGNPQKQATPEFGVFESPETAVFAALNFIYPISVGNGIEWGGRICRDGIARYTWGRFVSGTATHIDLSPTFELCAPFGSTESLFHTHPGSYVGVDRPSGYQRQAEYFDVGGSDLRVADEIPNGLWWYIAATPPNSVVNFVKYAGPLSKNNVWEYNILTGAWVRLPDAPW
jgi:hypothetical protein